MIDPFPISTAPVGKGGSWNEPVSKWMMKAGVHLNEASQVRQSTSGGEILSWSRNGATIIYDYTGLGGISFECDGTTVTIPKTTASQETTGTKLVKG